MPSRRHVIGATAALAVLAAAPRLVRAAADDDDGFTVLHAKPGVAPLRGDEGDPTAIWGFDGRCPGPTLRVARGSPLKVRLVNELSEATSIHWYGIRLANGMDGTPLTQAPVEPGASFDYVFVPPDAGTFWYRPDFNAARQVARGLYGPLIVEEASPPEGLHDVIMMIDDWWLLESDAIDEESFGDLMVAAHGGRMGNWLTVNAASRPRLAAPAGQRVRLRLVNVANARIMRLLFKGVEPSLLAIDGQPLVVPQRLGSEILVLPPGGRADIGLPRGTDRVTVAVEIQGEALDLAFVERTEEVAADAPDEDEQDPDAGGESTPAARRQAKVKAALASEIRSVVLATAEARRRGAKPAPQSSGNSGGNGAAGDAPAPDDGEFAALPANPLPGPLDLSAARQVKLVIEGGAMGGMRSAVVDGEERTMRELLDYGMVWALNGVAGLSDEPLVKVARGRTVTLTMENRTAWAHALHLHGHCVRIIGNAGQNTAGPAADSPWRDTVLVGARATVTVAFIADNPGKWLLECEILEHGETGMTSWLEVS